MIETDVLIVGAGPAGLAAAITLRRRGFAGRVVVLEKSRRIGDHVLSGAVIDPSGFNGLLTDEELRGLPVGARVSRESFRFLLGRRISVRIPWVPPMMRAKGFPVGSLADVTRYLAKIAERLGAEIYTGFAVTELVMHDGVVVGARTGTKGIDAQGRHKSNYLASEEIKAKTTILAEGGAGILTDRLVADLGLCGHRPQAYALGIRELIELPHPVEGSAGTIMHTFGYPVDARTYGGGFVYHVSDRRVAVGYAIGLDYHDATLDPHELFRRYKATSAVAAHVSGGRVVAYGAKLIPEGGFYAMPRPYAPGVLIVGDGAGLLDGLRIKGVHLALQSGVAAAQAILVGGADVGARYQELLQQTPGYSEVRRVRNVHGGFTYHAIAGVLMSGLAWATFGRLPWWMVGKNRRDAETLRPCRCRDSSASALPASALSPDRLTDVYLSGTRHEENQPCHLHVLDSSLCAACAEKYDSPCTRFCPAEVYRRESGALSLDFSNCLHCKTCSDKCPCGNIRWTFPEGGDGPRYT